LVLLAGTLLTGEVLVAILLAGILLTKELLATATTGRKNTAGKLPPRNSLAGRKLWKPAY
jgi:hypothetical protein